MKKRIIAELFLFAAVFLGVAGYYSYSSKNVSLPKEALNWDELSAMTKVENGEPKEFTATEKTREYASEKKVYDDFSGCYGYQVLSEEEQTLYAEMYNVLYQMQKDVEVSTTDTAELDKVFQCLMNDHPELFFLEGYTYTTYTRGDTVTKLTFSGTYTKTTEEREQCQGLIDTYVAECLSGINLNADDYTKVKYVYDYLINHTEYELDSVDNQNICSVFINKVSVCMGYARALQYLLLQMDIPCTVVNGLADGGQAHAWNLVMVDGNYYYVDVTWGDDSYTVTTDTQDVVGMINYGFFCVTTDEISRTHTIQNVVTLPRCVATAANYYVREGCYFTSLDYEQISSVFQNAAAGGKDCAELKCDSLDVYTQIHRYLIEEQHIFDYLPNASDTVSYYDGQELLLLEFWMK